MPLILANLVPLGADRPRPEARLLMLHHVGGDRNSFKAAVSRQAVLGGVEVWVVGYPGRIKGESTLSSVEALADEVFAAMMSRGEDSWAGLPLFVFGHSLGGIVAFELCRRLAARSSVAVASLVVSAVKSPQRLSEVNDELALNGYRAAHHCKGDLELVDYIRSIDGLPAGVAMEFLKMKLPAIRGDYRAFETYRYDSVPPPVILEVSDRNDATGCTPAPALVPALPSILDCEIVSFGGKLDVAVSHEDIQGWSAHTSGSYKHLQFTGGHFFFSDESCREPFAAALAAVVSGTCLEA